MSGSFIVLEGPDGAGTTTHSKLLAEKLKSEGQDMLLTAEPTNGPIGAFIRDRLKQKTIPSPAALQLLFCADRAWHVETVIKPAIAAGKTVICDRYTLSTIVYGQALGLDPRWLENINAVFPRPDRLILALPGIEVCLSRLKRRKNADVLENEAFQRKVHELYEQAPEQWLTIKVIDTSEPMEKVTEEILEFIKRS